MAIALNWLYFLVLQIIIQRANLRIIRYEDEDRGLTSYVPLSDRIFKQQPLCDRIKNRVPYGYNGNDDWEENSNGKEESVLSWKQTLSDWISPRKQVPPETYPDWMQNMFNKLSYSCPHVKDPIRNKITVETLPYDYMNLKNYEDRNYLKIDYEKHDDVPNLLASKWTFEDYQDPSLSLSTGINPTYRFSNSQHNNNANSNSNKLHGSTHVIISQPQDNQYYQMVLSIINQYKADGFVIPAQLNPDLLLQFIYFLKNLESNSLRISNISVELFNFFASNPDLKYLIQLCYSSPIFNSPAPAGKIENIQKFIMYLVKLGQGGARMADLTPEILSIIMKQQYPPEFLPIFPELSMLIREAVSFDLNIKKKLSDELMQFLLNIPLGILKSIICKLANDVNINSHVHPDYIWQLILFYKNPQLSNLPAKFMEFLNRMKNPQIPGEHEIVPDYIQIELERIIYDLIHNKKLNDMSPVLLEFIVKHPDLQEPVGNILKKENILPAEIGADIIIQLLKLIKDNKMNVPVKNIPYPLIDFILQLQGTDNLEKPVLDVVYEHNPSDIKSVLLQLLGKYGGKNIPLHIKNWLSTLPNGQDLLSFLEMPGEVVCAGSWKIMCTKTFEDTIPENIAAEIEIFIHDILNNKKLNNISPTLLEFIIKHPDLLKPIDNIFKKQNIPYSEINPDVINQLLHLIQKSKDRAPISEIPDTLLELLLNLKNPESINHSIVKWMEGKPQPDLIQKFLYVIKENGGKEIPHNLYDLLLLLPNGKEIIEFLELPGDIQCNQTPTGQIKCDKNVIHPTTSIPHGTNDELVKFIINIINNNKLTDLSPKLLEFILTYPDIEKLIFDIFQENNIPTTAVSPHTIASLLTFIRNGKTNTPIKDIPQSVLALVTRLSGAQNLAQAMLNWVNSNKQPDMIQIFLQIIEENGGKVIPPQLLDWLMSIPNGNKMIEYLQLPGEIKCLQEPNGVVKCTKTLINPTPDLKETNQELMNFILEIIDNHKLTNLSPKLLEFILHYPNIQKLIFDIFQKNNIPTSEVNPNTIASLLEFIVNEKNNTPIKDISPSALALVTKLSGAQNLAQSMFNWVSINKQQEMVQIFLQIIKENGGQVIPPLLREWLLSLPNGAKIIEYLQEPGEIECTQAINGNVKCVKTVINPTPRLDVVQQDANAELVNFVINIIQNNKLTDLSPKLLEFILKYPDIEKLIFDIFQKMNIPTTAVNPHTIASLLEFIISEKTNTPIKDIPAPVLALVTRLSGAQNLTKAMLNWTNTNKQPDMLQIFMQVIKENGGQVIPPQLLEWLLTIPNGKEITEYLQLPGDIECSQVPNGVVKCVKTVVHPTPDPKEVYQELKNFILEIINSNKLTDLSPMVLEFIPHYPNIQELIFDIFQKHNIPTSTVNPNTIASLLQFIINGKNNIPIKEIPSPVLALVTKLSGAKNLSDAMLNWVNTNKQQDMLQIFLQVIKENGGKVIPPQLLEWLLSIPNGKNIIEYLQLPGDIECTHEPKGVVKCVKSVINPTPDPKEINQELRSFILDIIDNNKLTDLSPRVLEFISHYPNIQELIFEIFHNNNIPTSTINPNTIASLLQFIINGKNNIPIKDIPSPVLALVTKLSGAKNLSDAMLNWVNTNKQPDMLQIFLQVIKENGGKVIPPQLLEWLLSIPDGKKIVEYLQLPGDIECTQEPNGVVNCVKTVINPTPDPKAINQELRNFILDITDNNKLTDLSPKALEFISHYPNLQELIFEIFQKNNIPTSTVNPSTIASLLHFIINGKHNIPIKDIPSPVLALVTKLSGAKNLSDAMLNWINTNKQQDMLQIFLQVIKENGGKVIPPQLLEWLLSIPNGKKIIEYLQLPGDIECRQEPNGVVTCIKTLINPTPDPKEINQELINFILDIIDKHKLTDLSPKLLEFISHYPHIKELIFEIFQKNNIPISTVNPNTIASLLQFIINLRNNRPVNDIPPSVLALVTNLSGAQNLSQAMLNWININKQSDMLQIFLQVVKQNGGKVIPPQLLEWLLSIPNGQKIIEFLQLPGDIECTQEQNGVVKCVKTVINSTPRKAISPVVGDASEELRNFILAIVNNNELKNLSPNVLSFILQYPNIEKLITDIFLKYNISTTSVHPQLVAQLLQFIINIQTNKSITDISPSLLALVTRLSNAENLTQAMLNWISINKQSDMIQIFLQVIKENGGKVIPPQLREWLLSLPNGKQIIEYLQMPGEIECTMTQNNIVKCVKTVKG